MVRLTEEMVVARTRVSDLAAVKKLNCWGTELTDVSILRHLKKVEVLALSVNKIDTLTDFQYCQNLQDLFIRKNNIKDLNEVCYLRDLPFLRNLWLDENPCSEQEGYRLAVLRVLPNLEKLDDKTVTAEEVQNALSGGKVLIHPMEMDASPTNSEIPSPEEIAAEGTDDSEPEQRRSYDASADQAYKHQRVYLTRNQHHNQDYQETDRRNANWCGSPTSQQNHSQSNNYAYEDYEDHVSGTESERYRSWKQEKDGVHGTESERYRPWKYSNGSNEGAEQYEQNSKRSYYPSNGENGANSQRSSFDRQNETSPAISPRTPYPPSDQNERRESALSHDEQQSQHYQDRALPQNTRISERVCPVSEEFPTTDRYRGSHQNNRIADRGCPASEEFTQTDRYRGCPQNDRISERVCPSTDDVSSRDRDSVPQGGWVKHTEKDNHRFYYHRRPVTRNSNILSAVLCLVKELDYPSLEVVEMAVANRMDELEE